MVLAVPVRGVQSRACGVKGLYGRHVWHTTVSLALRVDWVLIAWQGAMDFSFKINVLYVMALDGWGAWILSLGRCGGDHGCDLCLATVR